MNISIKHRVGCVLLSILLVIVFIGSMLCALILPFMGSNRVASAIDYSSDYYTPYGNTLYYANVGFLDEFDYSSWTLTSGNWFGRVVSSGYIDGDWNGSSGWQSFRTGATGDYYFLNKTVLNTGVPVTCRLLVRYYVNGSYAYSTTSFTLLNTLTSGEFFSPNAYFTSNSTYYVNCYSNYLTFSGVTSRFYGFRLHVGMNCDVSFKIEYGSIDSLEQSYAESGSSQGSYEDGYTDGYQAGVASVDTQSYYDQGYQAGDTAGYNRGYQAGLNDNNSYQEGYQAGVESVDTQSYYNQGIQDGIIQGLNQYVDNYSITSYLNTDTYVSTGGYSVQDGANTFDILNAQLVENHTRTGTEGVATIYDSLLAGVDYNIIYTQGSFSSVSSTTYDGIAGYYAVSSSLLASNGFNSYINAGTPFSLNNLSSRANTDRTSGSYRLVDLSIAFLDENANIIRFDPTQFENANFYINNNRIFSTSFEDQSIVGDSISTGQVHYYRLPFDIYGILIMSYHEATDYYHAYNMKLQFLPNSSFQDGYNAGFTAGESNVNTEAYYQNGYNQGFANGEIQGAAQASNYSFLGVIGAAVDAPIDALFKLLDFDLLGYNMKSFVGALFMLAFIVLIIRLVLGGK